MQSEESTAQVIHKDKADREAQIPNAMFERAEQFLRKHNWKLFKIASFSFGFILFLVYFCQNRFYPDFDIFGFASLLVAASILGGITVAFVTLGFCAPGLFWFYTFFQDPVILNHFKNHDTLNQYTKTTQHRLISSYFFIPSIVSLSILYACIFTLKTNTGYTTGLIIGPAVIGYFWGRKLQKEFSLPKWSSLKYGITALITFFLINIISLLLLFAAHDLLDRQAKALGDYLFAGMFLSLFSIFFAAIARLVQISLTHAIIAGSTLAVSMMLMSQAFIVLPGNVIRNLGIGNYDVQNVIFTTSACDQLRKIKAYGIDDKCQISHAHITWSMGSTYYLNWSENSERIFLRIDKQTIQSIQLVNPS
jgi:hypothetical protein